ncbi:hypothetical protein M5K25_018771 [Dendrobium thyrsiflorum]|uniref:Uncharacterized protein n=1 Tax=Dendrobium thyrsiflorum TaxID=117978 RepID=A0ABD0UK00_DENTH
MGHSSPLAALPNSYGEDAVECNRRKEREEREDGRRRRDEEGKKGHRFSAFAEWLEKEEAVLCRRKSDSLPEEEWFSAITGDSEKDIVPLPALEKV